MTFRHNTPDGFIEQNTLIVNLFLAVPFIECRKMNAEICLVTN